MKKIILSLLWTFWIMLYILVFIIGIFAAYAFAWFISWIHSDPFNWIVDQEIIISINK